MFLTFDLIAGCLLSCEKIVQSTPELIVRLFKQDYKENAWYTNCEIWAFHFWRQRGDNLPIIW